MIEVGFGPYTVFVIRTGVLIWGWVGRECLRGFVGWWVKVEVEVVFEVGFGVGFGVSKEGVGDDY